ncbi:protein HEG [Thalassophryne amazonica]|uniref:protein HEG n=1 Tax=Thalassophryne amazonica TaxID=390379 RepID=UPI00147099D5|nr:protein HEG [Thalassophryne amazonica]
METWFLNHVLGLSLSVLLLGGPGPLWAQTPNITSRDQLRTEYFSTQPSSGVFGFSASTHTLPPRTNVPHTHGAPSRTAANLDTEQTQTLAQSRSWSATEEVENPRTDPLTFMPLVATTEASSSSTNWEDLPNPEQVSDVFPALVARSWTVTDEARLPRHRPNSTMPHQDTTDLLSSSVSDSTYASTTISRAGERTLLSVTSSSSNRTFSVLKEESTSHQPPSTSGIPARSTETEEYTDSALSTRADAENTTAQHLSQTIKEMFSETQTSDVSSGTQTLTAQTNVTQNHHSSTPEMTSISSPPFRVTQPSTEQSEVPVRSTPPVTSLVGDITNTSETVRGSDSNFWTSIESSSEVYSSTTQSQENTRGVSSQTRENTTDLGLITAPPTANNTSSDLNDTQTDMPMLSTETFFTTPPITVTQRSQITEDKTSKEMVSTVSMLTSTPTPSLPVTSSSQPGSTSSNTTPNLPTQTTIPNITPSTAAFTPSLQTSAAAHTQHFTPSQTQASTAWAAAIPTNVATLQPETSTGSLTITTACDTTTTTYRSTATTGRIMAPQTTRKQTARATTEPVVTTAPPEIQPTIQSPPIRNPCVSNPCMNGGMCVSYEGHQFTCRCQQAWTGPTCSLDVDECETDPCPPGSRCVNTHGSFGCECPLGFDLEDGRTCTRAKTFLGTFSVDRMPRDPVIFKSSTMHEIQREIIQLLNASLSVLRGYSRSTLSKKEEDGVRISAVNMFSISTDVTSVEVYNSIQMSLNNCSASLPHCRMVLHHRLTYHVESLCAAQKTQCDTERSTCTDLSGTAYCHCLQGYYKHNPDDLSCLECGDGYKLENGTCVQCMFGFGGFNCGNFYKLIAVVVSPAGGALLLILVIALIVTCCKKDKNDISKIIFKSGDLQMSPYADFPKNNRISMEWGRETIEMQENGSTKNLLQMTDIYYSPALRNSDLERNGLYPFSGLPGSRHSCIYPAQWNPSFISDDSRRRDYF